MSSGLARLPLLGALVAGSQPASPESVRRRRKLAEQLAERAGESGGAGGSVYGAIAQGIRGVGAAIHAARADAEEQEGQARARAVIEEAARGFAAQGARPAGVPSVAAPPPGGDGVPTRSRGGVPANIPSFVAAAGEPHGISPSYMATTASLESGFNPNARNPSGASGLFQFMPGTARQYGLRDPFDGQASADAAARLASDNRAHLTRSLGRDPTDAELYLAHQQGAGGAASLLSNPNASAASIVGAKAVIQNGGRPGMSAGDFAGLWTRKFDQRAASFGQRAEADLPVAGGAPAGLEGDGSGFAIPGQDPASARSPLMGNALEQASLAQDDRRAPAASSREAIERAMATVAAREAASALPPEAAPPPAAPLLGNSLEQSSASMDARMADPAAQPPPAVPDLSALFAGEGMNFTAPQSAPAPAPLPDLPRGGSDQPVVSPLLGNPLEQAAAAQDARLAPPVAGPLEAAGPPLPPPEAAGPPMPPAAPVIAAPRMTMAPPIVPEAAPAARIAASAPPQVAQVAPAAAPVAAPAAGPTISPRAALAAQLLANVPTGNERGGDREFLAADAAQRNPGLLAGLLGGGGEVSPRAAAYGAVLDGRPAPGIALNEPRPAPQPAAMAGPAPAAAPANDRVLAQYDAQIAEEKAKGNQARVADLNFMRDQRVEELQKTAAVGSAAAPAGALPPQQGGSYQGQQAAAQSPGAPGLSALLAEPYVPDSIKLAAFNRAMSAGDASYHDGGDRWFITNRSGEKIGELPKSRAPLTVSGGATVYDPNTNRPVFTAPKEPELTTDQRNFSEAQRGGYTGSFNDFINQRVQRQGQAVTVKDANGAERTMFWDPVANRLKTPEEMGAPASAPPTNPYASAGKMTEAEAKNAGFANRMAAAHGIINDLEQVGTNTMESLLAKVPGSNALLSTGRQRLQQAQDDFANSVLRRESGAVIGKEEAENAKRQYFPQPGDGPEVIAQKRWNRELTTEGVMTGAGAGYKPPETYRRSAAPQPSSTDAQGTPQTSSQASGDGRSAAAPLAVQSPEAVGQLPSGTYYRRPDGTVMRRK